ncbi:MAG TPA: SUF system Fe-S cluster assembly protein [Gammaproteobacteria bacterium]|jgi:FeS assembly SUF system protein|nr:SUF system Fe-S cluster assembly protein [Gammaproteobacteria bacterium]
MIENWNDKAEEKAEPSPSEQAQAADETLEARVIDALRGIYDPEIPVNIYDLGLIYELRIDADGKVMIEMTLTAPGCPVAQTFPDTVKRAVKEVEGVSDARVELVWDPSWDPSRMSEAARLQLNLF